MSLLKTAWLTCFYKPAQHMEERRDKHCSASALLFFLSNKLSDLLESYYDLHNRLKKEKFYSSLIPPSHWISTPFPLRDRILSFKWQLGFTVNRLFGNGNQVSSLKKPWAPHNETVSYSSSAPLESTTLSSMMQWTVS